MRDQIASHQRQDGQTPPVHWDEVVVGGGSAGAVIAARMSERADRRVLLVEAGPDHTSASAPASIRSQNFLQALIEPGRLWDGLVVHRREGAPPTPYLRGRGVGGSSSVNAMIALRGLPEDYDRWERDFGCRGWGWQTMRHYLARAEQAGGITTVGPERRGPVDRALRSASEAAGFAASNGESVLGMMAAPLSMANGSRRSTNDTYLEAARNRKSANAGTLEIRGDTTVDRILLCGRRAVGVRLMSGEEVECKRVIVCAGAIHSPALLLRSGIERQGIGENLKEHPSAQAMLVLREGTRADIDASPISSLLRWSSSTGVEADLQLLPMEMAGAHPDAAGLGLVNVAVMQVHSSGRVRLGDRNDHLQPIVELGLLRDERDLVRLVEGFRVMLSLLEQQSVQAICDRIVLDELGTAATTLHGADDQALVSWISAHAGDYVHASGTCRMGTADDEWAVVDARCHVIGYEGLAVVDASIMPDLPRANTNLPVMAIAERAAEVFDNVP